MYRVALTPFYLRRLVAALSILAVDLRLLAIV